MKTPQYVTRTLAAGAGDVVTSVGHYITVISISASTIELGIDEEPLQIIRDRLVISVRGGFTRVRLRNAGIVASTIVMFVSDDRIDITSDEALDAIEVSLANIDADMEFLKPGTAPTLIPLTVVPIAPAAALQLVTAGGVKESMVQAPIGNAGLVYLGFAGTVDATDAFAELNPGDSALVRNDVDIYCICTAGVNNVRGYAIS